MNLLQNLILPVLAWFLIIVGVLSLVWPELARGRIIKKSGKMLLGWLIIAGMLLFSWLSSFSKTIGPGLTLAGLVLIIIVALWTWKASIHRIVSLAKNLSAAQLRIVASAHILIGIFMLVVKTRII